MEILKDVPINELKEWDKNPRKNDFAVERLKVLIEKYGYIDPIVVDQNNIIRAGHTRYKALKSLNMKTVPLVLRVEFGSEQDAIGYAIADNKSMEWAEWDKKQLAEVFLSLKDDGFDLEDTGFIMDEIDRVLEISEIKNLDKELYFEEKVAVSVENERTYITLEQAERLKKRIEEAGGLETWVKKCIDQK